MHAAQALSAELLRLPWLKQLDVRGNPLPPAAGTLPSDDPAAIIHASCSSVKYAGKEDGHSTGPSSGAAPRPATSAASVDDVQSGHSDRDDVEGWGWRRTQARMPLQSDVMRAGEDPAASGGGGGGGGGGLVSGRGRRGGGGQRAGSTAAQARGWGFAPRGFRQSNGTLRKGGLRWD